MTVPPPSWSVFLACNRCGAKAGEACYDMRGVPRGWVPNRRPHTNTPHIGRKKTRSRKTVLAPDGAAA